MLRCLLPVLLPAALALQAPAFRVPPVDFTQLSGASDNAYNRQLLSLLQQDGIIALQNVPHYAALRKEFLETAADCAVRAQAHGAEFLLHRRLRDDTDRFTVSLKSGLQLDETLRSSAQLLQLCPEYVQVHAAFSAAVELAVANVGSALDATKQFQVVVENEVAMTARRLLEESVHLDHFHAYEAAAGVAAGQRELEVNVADLSLELHTDNGLMIAMSAPEYFRVQDGDVQHVTTSGEDAGLLIQKADGEIVRPALRPDELILMLGSGIDDWIQTTPPLHSVLHGMRYPRGISVVGDEDSKLLRAWFGKMVLLEAHQVMANTGLTFGQYANQTTRYLVQETEDHGVFGSVACPPQRHLAASDNSCSLKTCTLKSTASASDLTNSCQITCNHDSTDDATKCEKFCDCEATTKTGTTCWMLCVENFSSDVCPGEQQCNNAATEDKLAMMCVGGTVAPTASSSTGSSSVSSSTNDAGSTSNTTTAPTTTSPTTTSQPATAAPATAGSSSASTATAGSTGTSPNVGDDTAAASTADQTSSTSSTTSSASASSSTSSSSSASVLHAAFFINGLAVVVAVFLCIQ